ncbi:MAG: hypothetical protein ACNA8L_08450 [Luteolibacter sp.]
MMRNYIIAACIFTLFTGHASVEGEEVTLQFVTFPKWTTREPIEMLLDEGKTLEFIAPSNSFSKPHQVPKLSTWALGRMTETEEGKPSFKVFGQAKSLNSNNQLILLIRTGNHPKDGIKVIALDSQLSQFGGGEFFYYNASSFEIGGMMGNSRFILKPGEHRIIKPKAEDLEVKEGMAFVQAVHLYRKGELQNPFFNSTWHVNPKARSMVFFYQDNDAKRLKMHTLQDFLP